MPGDARRLNTLGGIALIAGGLLFLVRDLLEWSAGTVPADGVAILAWVDGSRLALSFVSETSFFAAMLLIPGVVALYRRLADADRAAAVAGCGIIAAMIPVIVMLLVVQGRFVFPVFGLAIRRPEIAEFAAAVYYGGLHAVNLMMGVAAIILSVAMRRAAWGKPLEYLGYLSGAADIAGSYPFLIGPSLTLACAFLFATWFVAVGGKLLADGMHRLRPVSVRDPP